MTSRTKAAALRQLAAKGLAPRGLTRAEAAAYVGLGERAFAQRVADGKLPGAHPATGRWDRAALDRALGPAEPTREALRDEIDAAIDAA